MSSKKNTRTRKKILSLENQRKRIVSDLLSISTMLRGSYALVYTKCGKDNCWCKDGKGHPHPRITWSEKGQGITRKVPRDHIPWVRQVTNNYRQFRSLRRKLVGMEAASKKLLDTHENNLTKRTRTSKIFLVVKPRNRRKNSTSVPKKRNQGKNRVA